MVVWKLDRLSRSFRDVLTIMEWVKEREAGFRSLTEAIDTTTPAGRMMMQMVKLKPQQRQEIVRLVKSGPKTAADAVRLFGVHPATVSRLLRSL